MKDSIKALKAENKTLKLEIKQHKNFIKQFVKTLKVIQEYQKQMFGAD